MQTQRAELQLGDTEQTLQSGNEMFSLMMRDISNTF